MRGFRGFYGSSPLHLIGHLLAFVVAGWAIGQILGGGKIIDWLVWFLGAALLHDLVLLPLYSAVDRALRASDRRSGAPRRHTPALNYLRAPAMIAGVLLLVYFPLILGLSSANYRRDTGHALAGYTRNWLLITAGLFAVSAMIYLVRVAPRPSRTRSRSTPPSAPPEA